MAAVAASSIFYLASDAADFFLARVSSFSEHCLCLATSLSFSSVNLLKKKLLSVRICLIGEDSSWNLLSTSFSSNSYSLVIFFVAIAFPALSLPAP
jgi:hypothetical protein